MKYDEVRNGLKGRLNRTSVARSEVTTGTTMVPLVFANQIMHLVSEAADGGWYQQQHGTTKGIKLLNANAGLHILAPDGELKIEMVRLPAKELVELLSALEELAKNVRTGEWKLSLNEYDSLALELINDFCDAYGMKKQSELGPRYGMSRDNRLGHYNNLRNKICEGHQWADTKQRNQIKKLIE